MATYWHTTKRQNLTEKLKEIEASFEDCAIVKAYAIVKGEGAFVLLNSRKEAEKTLLHNTLIIYSEKTVNSYESLLGELDFSHAVFISAESKTADIEKKLISGVHGAKECHFVVVKDIQ